MSAQGISYEFSVEGKSTGVDEANAKMSRSEQLLSKLDKLTDAAPAKTKAATNANKQHAESFKGVGHAVEEAHGKLIGFLEFAGAAIAFEAIKKITEGIMELGGEILKAAGGAEKMALSLKLNVGVEGAKGVLEWIDEIASKTNYTDDQLKGWSNQLLKSGVAMKDLKSYIAAGLDLAAKGGDAGSIFEQMGRAGITGKIGLRQLVSAGVPVKEFSTLPEYAGLSQKALGKKVDSGSLTMDQVIQVAAGKNGVVGDEGIEAGKLLEAKLKNLKTLPDQYYQKFADSGSFDKMKSRLDDMFKSLDPESERGKKIFDSMDRMFTKLIDGLTKVDFEKVATSIERIFNAMAKFVDIGGKMASGTSTLVGGTASAAGKAFDVAAAPTKFIFGKLFGDSKESGGDIADGLAKGIEGKTPAVGDAAEGMVDETDRRVREAAMIQSPSKLFHGHGKNVALGFALGVESGQARIDTAMEDAFAVPVPGAGRAASVAAMGSPQITIEVNVEGRGKGDDELAHLIATEVAAVVPSMLLGAFEQGNMESGSA